MSTRAALTLALVLLAAGCLGSPAPGGAPASASCDAVEKPLAPSGNAPTYAAFRGTPGEVAGRMARAVGETLASTDPDPSRSDDRAWIWDTKEGGSVQIGREADGSVTQATWMGKNRWNARTEAQARPVLTEALDALGLPTAPAKAAKNTNPGGNLNLYFSQSLDGAPVVAQDGTLLLAPDLAILQMRPWNDLSGAKATGTVADAEARAALAARCALDREGKTEAAGYALEDSTASGLTVSRESLSYHVLVRFSEPGEPGHCDLMRAVAVDAVTRAVNAVTVPLCD